MTLETLYPELVGIRLNMVVSGSGKFTDELDSSRGISSEADRKLIGYLRSVSDVVVTGGETARRENYTVPKSADLAIISRSTWPKQERLVVLNAASDNLIDFSLQELSSRGYRRVLLETGPTLSSQFLKADQVDEFCLTVVGGQLATAVGAVASLGSKLQLASSWSEQESLFTIWRRGNV